ncbi:glycosyltransferase family 2 protein [Mucilaginibacter ximonensis]|uniref:Glycosyltransferase family 2 protein n=1 Tax=Mucilaginibacter ximonensis TaxID=538021 RepID=A0ABW5YEU5_9SPHI
MTSNQTVISIIIATYNSADVLQRCLDSIIKQTVTNFELIIVDGNSTDGTVNVIKNNAELIDKWVSEPDNGIYDAWNKGVNLSTGNWVMFLGADDELLPEAIESYKNFVAINNEVEYVSARVNLLEQNGDLIRVFGDQWDWGVFKIYMNVAHVSSLHSKKLFEKYGLFDATYKVTGDYELLLRAKNKLNAAFLNKTVANMRTGGVSSTPAGAFKESRMAKIKTGGRSYYLAIFDELVARTKYGLRKVIKKL